MEANLFGQMLVRSQMVTPEELDRALKVQSSTKPWKMLGKVLVELGYVSEPELESLLTHQVQTVEVSKAQSKFTTDAVKGRLQKGRLEDFLLMARELGASDLYISSDQRPVVRIHGNLVDLPAKAIPRDRSRPFLLDPLPPALRTVYDQKKYAETVLDLTKVGRFRVNVFRHFRGIAAMFRVIPEKPWPFERLALPQVTREFVNFPHGLVLVSGPMGSGRSTTLASFIDLINRTQKSHVVTIEDPIEVMIPNQSSIISQRQVGLHSETYAASLRAALREDPDVITVSELNDTESVATAISAAETGHLVFGAMPTQNAYRTILRVLEFFGPSKRAHVRALLASSLRAVVSQQLVPHKDGRGRSVAVEVLLVNSAVSNLIREDRIWQIPMIMQVSAPEGMRLMDNSLRELVDRGSVSIEDAAACATDREKFLENL